MTVCQNGQLVLSRKLLLQFNLLMKVKVLPQYVMLLQPTCTTINTTGGNNNTRKDIFFSNFIKYYFSVRQKYCEKSILLIFTNIII